MAITALVAVSLLLRMFVRDRCFPFNFNFYLPAPVLAVAGVCGSLAMGGRWARRGLVAAAIVVLSLVAYWRDQPRLFSFHGSTENAAHDFVLMEYNVKSYSYGSKKVIDTILEANPDVLCLVEGTFRGRAPERVVTALGPEYHWAVGRGLSIASRYPIRESRQLVNKRDIKVLRAEMETEKGTLVVFSVDFRTPGTRGDVEAFDELYGILHAEENPAVVAGDFNTPRGSYHLKRATEGWSDCFVEAGMQRYQATWPALPFPLWQIDHAFRNDGLETVRARIGESLSSDHLPVMVSLRFAAGDQASSAK